MNNFFLNELDRLLSAINEEYRSVRIYANTPDRTRLMISKYRGNAEFFAVSYKDGQRIRRGINKDKTRIYRLAHKAYVKEYARRLKADRDILASAINKMLPLDYNSMIHTLPEHFDILYPEYVLDPGKAEKHHYPNPSRDVYPNEVRLSLFGTDVWEWASEPYCENTDHLENKTHLTRSGHSCRSKSEALIFEVYMSLGLPFHYDETITIGERQLSPDFIGVRKDGCFVFHEHCGLHSESYRARNDWKSGLYASADIYPGDNLIYTYDDPSGSINIKLAEAVIRDAYKL